MSDTFDAVRPAAEEFVKARRAEYWYGAQLRKIARHIADLVNAFAEQGEESEQLLQDALSRYSDAIRPWAQAVARRMLADVSRREQAAWARYARLMGRTLRLEIMTAPTGPVMRKILDDQVHLITSLPIEAGRKVQEAALQSRITGARFVDLRDIILRTQKVTVARATLIARTETAKASTALTQARAMHIGSEGYIWRTVRDADVRPSIGLPPRTFARLNTLAKGSHRKLEGTYHKWTEPPISGPNGERSHPGMIYNCRCVPEPVIPDKYL